MPLEPGARNKQALERRVMLRRFANTVGLIVLLSHVASAQTTQPAQPPFDIATTALCPVVTVPVLQYTPRIDGLVDVKGEYYPSTRTHDFICLSGDDRGTAGAYPTYAVI